MEWLNSLAVVDVDCQFAGMVRRLASQLPGALAAVLTQAAVAATELIEVLQRDPQAELQAMLEVLEPLDKESLTELSLSGESGSGC